MPNNIDNLVSEHLKKIQAEQANARERDQEILTRLAHIESGIARITRDEGSNYTEIIENRHMVDRLADRISKIERRLELA